MQTDPLPWLEVGRLYAAVAGLLNVVAMCDAVGEVLAHNDRIRVQADLRRRFMEERQRELDRMIAAREAAEAEAAEARAALAALQAERAREREGLGELPPHDPRPDTLPLDELPPLEEDA